MPTFMVLFQDITGQPVPEIWIYIHVHSLSCPY